MSKLVKTTIDELAELADDIGMDESIIFSSEDPDELNKYNLPPVEYNMIHKTKLLHEDYYVIIVGLLHGHCTIAKDIYILSGGNVDDEKSRVCGIKMLLEEYYDEHMEKNKDGKVYLISDQ